MCKTIRTLQQNKRKSRKISLHFDNFYKYLQTRIFLCNAQKTCTKSISEILSSLNIRQKYTNCDENDINEEIIERIKWIYNEGNKKYFF